MRLSDKRSCVFTRSWTLFVVDCKQLKNERLLVVYVCCVCCGSKNSKDVSFRSIMISLEKSVSTWRFPVNKVIKLGCWEAPYLWLVTYWQWHYWISWENGGRITKTPALIAGAPFPFPSFVLFSLPLSLPFLCLPRRLSLLKLMMLLHQMSTQSHNGNCLAILEKIDVDMVTCMFRISHSHSQWFCYLCILHLWCKRNPHDANNSLWHVSHRT